MKRKNPNIALSELSTSFTNPIKTWQGTSTRDYGIYRNGDNKIVWFLPQIVKDLED